MEFSNYSALQAKQNTYKLDSALGCQVLHYSIGSTCVGGLPLLYNVPSGVQKGFCISGFLDMTQGMLDPL